MSLVRYGVVYHDLVFTELRTKLNEWLLTGNGHAKQAAPVDASLA